MSLSISTSCVIRNGQVLVDGELHCKGDGAFDEFIKQVYRQEELKYPKFFKMDRLSKLAFVASSLCLKGQNLTEIYDPTRIGIYLANRAASLDTDRQHQQAIQSRDDYFPSPAVFVYTLPNIAIGEIAIKHKIFGPNNFFIFDKFDALFFAQYITDQFELNKVEAALFGWVDVDEGEYDASLFLVENKEGETPLNEKHLIDLYNR